MQKVCGVAEAPLSRTWCTSSSTVKLETGLQRLHVAGGPYGSVIMVKGGLLHGIPLQGRQLRAHKDNTR